jgi:hypothetical protein
VKLVSYKDAYTNLPLVFHSQAALPEGLHRTLDAIRAMVAAWDRQRNCEVASYSIGFPVQDREAWVSVMGHVSDLKEWLDDPLSTPPVSFEEIHSWVERVSDTLAQRYPAASDTPRLSDTLMPSGLLLVRRRPIEGSGFRPYYSEERRALMWELSLAKEDTSLAEALRNGRITPAIAILVLESRCMKCGLSYPGCPCSKLLDEEVVQEITEARIAFPFWTDHPIWHRRARREVEDGYVEGVTATGTQVDESSAT